MSHCCFFSYCPLLSDCRLGPPSLPVACYFQWILLVTWGLESWPVNKSGQEVEGSTHSGSRQRLSLQLSETKRESLPESCPLSPSPSSNDGSCVRWNWVPRDWAIKHTPMNKEKSGHQPNSLGHRDLKWSWWLEVPKRTGWSGDRRRRWHRFKKRPPLSSENSLAERGWEN